MLGTETGSTPAKRAKTTAATPAVPEPMHKADTSKVKSKNIIELSLDGGHTVAVISGSIADHQVRCYEFSLLSNACPLIVAPYLLRCYVTFNCAHAIVPCLSLRIVGCLAHGETLTLLPLEEISLNLYQLVLCYNI